MSNHIAIEISGAAGFYLVGQASDTLGKVFDADGELSTDFVDIVRIVGPCDQAPDAHASGPCNLIFAAPLRIPGALITGNAFTSAEVLGDQLKAGARAKADRFIATTGEAMRRMLTIDVDAAAQASAFLGLTTPFGSAGGFAGAQARFSLWSLAPDNADEPISVKAKMEIELAAHARFSAFGVERAASLVVMVGADAVAALRIDADDLGLRFPPFALPKFDLTKEFPPLELHKEFTKAVSTIAQLGIDTGVSVEHANNGAGAPKLVLQARKNTTGLDWLVATGDYDHTTDELGDTDKIAKFKVATQAAGAVVVEIVDLQLGDVAGRDIFRGTVKASMAPIDIPSQTRRFGPFEISWSTLTVTPSHQGNAFGGAAPPDTGTTLRAVVSFERLVLRVADDPDAFLIFTGKVEIDPSGTRLLELALVAPFPLVLLAKAADSMLRGAAAVMNVLIDSGQMVLEQLQQLLDVLGRMALAAGRAALFVGDKVAGTLATLGDLVAGALAAVAEMLGALLKQLNKLVTSAPGKVPAIAIELRIGTSPLELRQVLITSRDGGADLPARKLELLGFRLDIPNHWQPGLLLDFVTQPGAYLVLSCEKDPAADLTAATLSTDLWLERSDKDGLKTDTRALRDVDGSETAPKPRDKTVKPLIELDLKFKNVAGASSVMLVLAGLTRGQTIFFQRLDGGTKLVDVPGKPGVKVRTADGPFRLTPLDDMFDLDVKFEKDRILPLLGMGESGEEAEEPAEGEPNFLQKLQDSLSNVVWVKDTKPFARLSQREAGVDLVLGLKAAGVETSLTLKASISLDSLAVTLKADSVFPITSQRIEENALGLLWVIEQADPEERAANTKIDMFTLGFSGGQSGFELNSPKPGGELKGTARMQLRFNGLSSDGQGVLFEVSTFKIGPGGLDLVAKVSDKPVRLNGIDVPFHFTDGALEIKGGRLVSAMIAGRGSLPPDLIGEADCTVALTFGEVEGEGIVLQSGKVELDKKGDPVICHTSRFTLTITDLDVAFVKDGGYHFYFLVTGSLRFTPKPGEFENGLLQYLDGVEMNLERTPLSADPRVLLKHISFQKTLNPKKSFNLFNLFTFELRGFGYHPASPKFGGDPAVNISGQIKFVEIGDVMAPSIDFHGLWIAPPKEGESLPRIKADGLGIDLNLKGAIRVRGAVIAVDADTRTVEGSELAPEGYNAYGFLGRGEFDIPGWGSMGASLGFLELEHKERPGERRKSFFFYADKKKLAIEIPTVVWNFYLREAGFGLGFRYTLDAISAADRATSIPKLISALDEVSKTQGDLHKFSAWKPEFEGDRVTLALKGAIQVYPASKTWDEEAEKAAQNPFLFDLVAAIRSDFTLFMGLRGWVGTNYIDYLNDKDGLRSNPGLRGYLYISAPQQRLLARMIGDSKGYIGERIPALAKGSPMRAALQSVDWSATLFIKPGLFHYELGWPNQLAVRLFDQENMRVTVRGGMIFRAAEDGLLWGYNIEADAYFRFGGALQIGPVGVCAEATLTANLVARVLCYLTWRVTGSLIYGLVALDAQLAVSFRAWLEVDLGFTSFTIRIGFSRTLQFSAAVELAISTEGVGARVHARVAISVFGCTLSVSVGFVIGQGQLDEARARVQRFLAMSITAEEPDAAPAGLARSGDQRLESDAAHAQAPALAPTPADVKKPNAEGKAVPASQHRSQFGVPARETDFWCVLHQASVDPVSGNALAPEQNYGYAMLTPRESVKRPRIPKGLDKEYNPFVSAFYAPAAAFAAEGERDAQRVAHTLLLPTNLKPEDAALLAEVLRYDVGAGKFVPLAFVNDELPVLANWNKLVDTEGGPKILTLALLFDECFLSDTDWYDPALGAGKPYRRTKAWREPITPRIHANPTPPPAGTEQERNSARDLAQRAHAADADANPVVDGMYQARSSVLSMFADQFVTLSETGAHTHAYAHVTDLGLVFFGPVRALEKLALLAVRKDEPADVMRTMPTAPGAIAVFNPWDHWFAQQDPKLDADDSLRATDAVKLGWQLTTSFSSAVAEADGVNAMLATQANPEQFLHHYEIVRTVEAEEFKDHPVSVKPAATLGERDAKSGVVTLMAPDWQHSDALSDLDPEVRRALLPSNDENAAMAGAVAWATRFGERRSLSLSYTVTPVDIAGSRGMPKSFLVDIPRPAPPLRPADAELRFIVKRMGPGLVGNTPHHAGAMPGDVLAVVMALRDPSPQKPAKPQAADVITRGYRLIADPENISPSGHYGTDGLTERRPGLAATFKKSGDERKWSLKATDFVDLREMADGSFIDALEPDRDTVATYPFWSLLAGTTGIGRVDSELKGPHLPIAHEPRDAVGFLASLWRRGGEKDGERIATRFALETIQEQTGTTVDGRSYTIVTVSKRVPVNIEVRIEPLDPVLQEIGLLRPDAFEWPVHLDLPPHAPGQVRASTGFACFRVPPQEGRLDDLIGSGGSGACALVRDPERRILTEVSFDAMPGFAGDSGAAVDTVHASSVAGFDLHELDLDDLAPLDTVAAPVFASNATTWRRARRVARIERVSADMARLLPDSNKDWPGWQAHYPSETWRLAERAERRALGQSVPRRAAWFSAAESTVKFAARVPRLRLFPTASESAVSALMADGLPDRVLVSCAFSVAADAPSELAGLAAALNTGAAVAFHALAFGETAVPAYLGLGAPIDEDGRRKIVSSPAGATLSPARMRAALMGLTLTLAVSPEVMEALMNALAEGSKLACTLKLESRCTLLNALGKSVERRCGLAELPVALAGGMHPILEEVVGELEYSAGNDGLYRRYVVSVQPVQPVEATTMAAFLADSTTETDPYGWAALQQLGLAATIKLYDRDLDCFVGAEALLQRVRRVFSATVSRYQAATAGELPFGQPFVDVLLRPGRDRTPGPFDAVLSSAGVELERGDLWLDDDALSIAQLSLRPTPVRARRFFFLDMRWQIATWPHALLDVPEQQRIENAADGKPAWHVTVTTTRTLAGYELQLTAQGGDADDLTGMQDGRTAELRPNAPQLMPLQSYPKGRVSSSDPDLALQFFLRSRDPDTLTQPKIDLKARVRITVTTTVEEIRPMPPAEKRVGGSSTSETSMTLAQLKEIADMSDPEKTKFPIDGLVSAAGGPAKFVEVLSPAALSASPYERFRALSPDDWAEALDTLGKPTAAFRTLRDNLRFAAPALAWPGPVWVAKPARTALKEITAAYLPWVQRFLDHAAGPDYCDGVQFALAAPLKANPLNLAANSAGQLTLSFLHADRWAHARVYAVRPTPRYQNQALGAGYYETQSDSEQLVTAGLLVKPGADVEAFVRPIGYALAVSPRTERIEPPVILGSRLVRRDYAGRSGAPVSASQWELVLARHGEEALAFSNRPLYARLGTQGTALTFVREYRDAGWPEKFSAAIGNGGAGFNVYPERAAALPMAADGSAAIDGDDLGTLSYLYPSLWKGADVWRVSELPAHYRVTVMAVARAGLVVSRVVASVQDATPRRPLDLALRVPQADREAEAAALAGKPQLAIERVAKHSSAISLAGLRMVSHADLSEVGSHGWFTGGDADVAWIPDPNVRYTLLRRGKLGAGRSFEDEDAEVSLVARELAPASGKEQRPIVLRCRGTRFAPPDGSGPEVSYKAEGGRRNFSLTFGLKLAPNGEAPEVRKIRLAQASADDVTGAFNAAAVNFAAIRNVVRIEVGPHAEPPADAAAAKAWLKERAAELVARADDLAANQDAALLPAGKALRDMAKAMEAEADKLNAPAPFDPPLQRLRVIEVELEPVPLDALGAGAPFPLKPVPTGAQVLTVYDVPTEAEAKEAAQSAHPAASAGSGVLWQACRERLLGAGDEMAIRVVDTRNAIDKQGPPGEQAWITPGEMETQVGLPAWTKW
ncbi:MAG: hypothetical protein V4693_18185 [Pseudomonadota bacterium]